MSILVSHGRFLSVKLTEQLQSPEKWKRHETLSSEPLGGAALCLGVRLRDCLYRMVLPRSCVLKDVAKLSTVRHPHSTAYLAPYWGRSFWRKKGSQRVLTSAVALPQGCNYRTSGGILWRLRVWTLETYHPSSKPSFASYCLTLGKPLCLSLSYFPLL